MRIKLGVGVAVATLSVGACLIFSLEPSRASVNPKSTGHAVAAPAAGEGAGSLESVASRAGETARKVAMSLIGLALAVAGVLLAFRRDFREAVGVFAVGIVAVLLATPAGLDLLRSTVDTLFGA